MWPLHQSTAAIVCCQHLRHVENIVGKHTIRNLYVLLHVCVCLVNIQENKRNETKQKQKKNNNKLCMIRCSNKRSTSNWPMWEPTNTKRKRTEQNQTDSHVWTFIQLKPLKNDWLTEWKMLCFVMRLRVWRRLIRTQRSKRSCLRILLMLWSVATVCFNSCAPFWI